MSEWFQSLYSLSALLSALFPLPPLLPFLTHYLLHALIRLVQAQLVEQTAGDQEARAVGRGVVLQAHLREGEGGREGGREGGYVRHVVGKDKTS